ncbi:MAG: DUF4830 domain-containing protein [Clostridiales bacterium]|nr:DUF4830 domain-containing protein [Clostridiales bacterium]
MFVFSLKASKLKIFFTITLCALAAASAFLFIPDFEKTVKVNGMRYDKKISFDGIKDEEDVKKFAENLGFSVETPKETEEIKIPVKFDAVTQKYNDLQKSQGFNIEKYKNKTVKRYTFSVSGLPDNMSLPEDEVLLTLLVYKDKIIGGDLYFTGKDERVAPFLK